LRQYYQYIEHKPLEAGLTLLQEPNEEFFHESSHSAPLTLIISHNYTIVSPIFNDYVR
jgi:hypothetical protein